MASHLRGPLYNVLWSRRSRIDHGLVAGPSPARSWRWRRWCWRERQAWRARSSCLLAHTRQAPASRLSTGGGSCCSPSSAQGAPSLDAHVVGRLSAPLPTPPRLSCAWRARNSYLLAHTRQAPLRVVLSTGGGSCCSPSSAQGAPSLDAHPCESHRALVHLRRRSGPYGDGLEGYCPTHHHLAGRPPTRIVVFL